MTDVDAQWRIVWHSATAPEHMIVNCFRFAWGIARATTEQGWQVVEYDTVESDLVQCQNVCVARCTHDGRYMTLQRL